jgi:hypothetical protein
MVKGGWRAMDDVAIITPHRGIPYFKLTATTICKNFAGIS